MFKWKKAMLIKGSYKFLLFFTAHSDADMLGLLIGLGDHPEIEPIYVTPRRADQINSLTLLETFENFSQSQRAFFNFDEIQIQVDKLYLPRGGAYVDINEFSGEREKLMLRKRSLIMTRPYMTKDDKNCFAVAVSLGVLNALEIPFPRPSLIHKRDYWRNTVSTEIDNLVSLTGVDLNAIIGLASIGEFEAYQMALIDYTTKAPKFNNVKNSFRIIIYNSNADLLFAGKIPAEIKNVKYINLLLHLNHFSVIKSLTAVFATRYFCIYCHRGFPFKESHKNCAYTCTSCFTTPSCDMIDGGKRDEKYCDDCSRVFLNSDCFQRHKKNGVCKRLRVCKVCFRILKKNHDCNLILCSTCKVQTPKEHDCMIQRYVPKEFKGVHAYVFFDLESMIQERDQTSGSFHVPNLCVSNVVCDRCIAITDDDHYCEVCHERTRIFKRDPQVEFSVIDAFLSYLFELAARKIDLTVIGHNAGRYDFLFLAKRLFQTQELKKPFIVMNGMRIYMIKTGRLRFVDSFNFSCCALSKLPKMFNLGNDLFKGYFPHLFNREENQKYVGVHPPQEFYEPESFKPDEYINFQKWYSTVKNTPFDFEQEVLEYCKLDVKILRLFCVKLTNHIFEECGITIFRESCTLASYVSKRFRKDFYQDNIAIIPNGGYRLRDNQSTIGIKYLTYLEDVVFKKPIQSAYRGLEKIIVCDGLRLKVDGYVETVNTDGTINKIVIEFFGCLYHGHTRCQPRLQTHNDDDIGEAVISSLNYEQALKKVETLRKHGYQVIVQWECEFNKFLKSNPEVKKSLVHINKEKLESRDSLFGGSVDCVSTYVKCGEDEEIRYYDVCSLYPTVNKYDKNIVGVPKIIIGGDCLKEDIASVDGLIKCRVLPPTQLFHPILPLKMNGKLLFPLCYACAQAGLNAGCTHNDHERSWVGTFVLDELREGLKYGYTLGKIYEIWKYETVQGLFNEYVKHFQKEKLYASGIPEGITNDNFDEFIREYQIHEDVTLEKSKFESNPAKRNFAKITLNSLWGKFAQRSRSVTAIVKDEMEFFKLVTDKTLIMKGFRIITDEVLLVNYDNLYAKPLNTTNVVVAAFTTAAARIRLNRLLQKTVINTNQNNDSRSCYFDTDSIIYVQKKNEPELLTVGPYLGDLTNELTGFGPNAYIKEFVSTGPKSYAYVVTNTSDGIDKHVVKVKGITLNVRNKEIINFDSLRNLTLNAGVAPNLSVVDTLFVREKNMEIRTLKRSKEFKAVVNKRRVIGYRTYPYGYKFSENANL